MNKKITIAVAGTGYVGLSIATLLAQHNKSDYKSGSCHTERNQSRKAIAKSGNERNSYKVAEDYSKPHNNCLGRDCGGTEICGRGFADHHNNYVICGVIATNARAAEEAYDPRWPTEVCSCKEHDK